MECVRDDCESEADDSPSMPQWLYNTVCKFHWYVWKAENRKSFIVNDRDDFTREEVLEEAEGRES
jgi:hypothetical protein